MPRRALALLLAAASLIAAPERGRAGAWTLEKGRALVIMEVGAVSADSRFDRRRERVDSSAFRKSEAHALVEYGLSDRVTLRSKASYEGWRQDGIDGFEGSSRRGPGIQEVGGRVRLIERGPFVGSAEASLRIAEAFGGGVELEYEARFLGGYGFTLAGLPAFVDTQLGYRLRPDASTDEILLDLTAGVRPFQHTLLLLQSFSTVAASTAGDGRPVYDRHKLRASVVFDLNDRWSLQAGGGGTVAGSETLEERSLFAAVWLRF